MQTTTLKISEKNILKKPRHIGNSIVITIAPMHVARLAIDDSTFFEQKAVPNGILLEMRKLAITSEHKNEK